MRLAQDGGAKLSKPKQVQIADQYLDTPEKFFQSSHLECRIRLSVGLSELTLKSIAKPRQQLFIRKEITVPLPHLPSKKAALTYCQKNFFKDVQPLFEILNNRQIHTLTLPCGTCAEASFDRVSISRGEKRLEMREIELEFKSGHVEQFKMFVSRLAPFPLKPSKSSKYQVAMGLEESPPEKDPLSELANLILKTNLEKLKNSGELDAEAIHDMRVAARRLRAAIQTFKKTFPENAKKIGPELQTLGQRLGKKRDLDIFSDFIRPNPELSRKLESCQKQLIKRVKSKEFAHLLKSLDRLTADSDRQNIFKVSRKQIRTALQRVLEIAPCIDLKVDDKTLHKLRISVKKLRYVCEFFQTLFSLDSLIEKSRQIQDLLGEHQDAITGLSLLNLYKKLFSPAEFQRISKRYEVKKKRTFQAFFKVWKVYCGEIGFQTLPGNAIGFILQKGAK